MVSADQIRNSVSDYLLSGDSDSFVLKFAELSFNVHKNGDREAIALVREIEAKISSLQTGCISKPDFQNFLRTIANPFATNVPVQILFGTLEPINFEAEIGMASLAWAGFFGRSVAKESESEQHSAPK